MVWKEGTSREVWLKGEAFFHVSKTPTKARFIVHTERFDVVVTGTQFNVMNRAGKDQRNAHRRQRNPSVAGMDRR